MKDKTKKWLAIAGLLAVCAVLVFGISRVLYHEPDREAQAVERESEETELFVETETPEPAPAESTEAETVSSDSLSTTCASLSGSWQSTLLIPNTSTAHTARNPATASHFFVLSFMAFPPYAFLIDFRSSHATIERLESLWKCNKSYDICNMLLKFLPVGRPHLQSDRHIR